MFFRWHLYLKNQIAADKLTVRAFTANNHYLRHIPYMIEEQGPLRYYSCRASERSIKTQSHAVKSGSRASVNASNNLVKRGVLASSTIKESLGGSSRGSPRGSEHYLENPSGNPGDPELWGASLGFVTLGNGSVCGGLKDREVERALKSYYVRLNPMDCAVDNLDIQLAKRLWTDTNVISSVIYRKKSHLTTRADNFVMFESGRYRR